VARFSSASIASASASAADSGRTMTVKSSISPCSSVCRKSQPWISRSPTRALKTSA
jgi:hypothetical protein